RRQVGTALDEPDVESPVAQALLDGLGVADEETRNDAGVRRLELAEDLRQQEVRDRRARTDEQRARDLSAQVLQPGVEFRRQRQDPLGVSVRDRARGREADAAVGAVE